MFQTWVQSISFSPTHSKLSLPRAWLGFTFCDFYRFDEVNVVRPSSIGALLTAFASSCVWTTEQTLHFGLRIKTGKQLVTFVEIHTRQLHIFMPALLFINWLLILWCSCDPRLDFYLNIIFGFWYFYSSIYCCYYYRIHFSRKNMKLLLSWFGQVYYILSEL